MQRLAGRVQGVVARFDAAPAQCPLAYAGPAAPDGADEVLHPVVGDRFARQECAGTGDEGGRAQPRLEER